MGDQSANSLAFRPGKIVKLSPNAARKNPELALVSFQVISFGEDPEGNEIVSVGLRGIKVGEFPATDLNVIGDPSMFSSRVNLSSADLDRIKLEHSDTVCRMSEAKPAKGHTNPEDYMMVPDGVDEHGKKKYRKVEKIDIFEKTNK